MERLKTILVNVLNIDENIITDELSPADVSNWDSFNALMLVSEIENAFGIKFTLNEIVEVKNVGDIKKALAGHGVILKDQ
jgi:acyl carrier protein